MIYYNWMIYDIYDILSILYLILPRSYRVVIISIGLLSIHNQALSCITIYHRL